MPTTAETPPIRRRPPPPWTAERRRSSSEAIRCTTSGGSAPIFAIRRATSARRASSRRSRMCAADSRLMWASTRASVWGCSSADEADHLRRCDPVDEPPADGRGRSAAARSDDLGRAGAPSRSRSSFSAISVPPWRTWPSASAWWRTRRLPRHSSVDITGRLAISARDGDHLGLAHRRAARGRPVLSSWAMITARLLGPVRFTASLPSDGCPAVEVSGNRPARRTSVATVVGCSQLRSTVAHLGLSRRRSLECSATCDAVAAEGSPVSPP